jgi:hypothetical protein
MAIRSAFQRERSRRRRRFLGRSVLFLCAVGLLVGLAYSAYQTGTELALLRVKDLETRADTLTKDLAAANLDAARLRSELANARQANAALQRRYEADVPAGDAASLYKLVQERLAQSLPAARLAQVLRDTAATRPCEARIIRRRFAIQQGSTRTEDPASLLEGLVVVTASGDAAKTTLVQIRTAWLDEPIKLTGLPARQDIVINNVVLHLTVEPSDVAGFASASLSVCGKA